MLVHPFPFVAAWSLLACGLLAQVGKPQPSAQRRNSRVFPESGKSRLTHINRSFGDTSLGKNGRLGSGPLEGVALHASSVAPASRFLMGGAFVTVVLTGGTFFTFREFERLTKQRDGSAAPVCDLNIKPHFSDVVGMINLAEGVLLKSDPNTASRDRARMEQGVQR
jgi:hypothetical protein